MKSLQNYKAIFFDMDGVLVDSERIYLQALQEYLYLHNIEEKQENLLKYIGKSLEVISRGLLKEYSISETLEECMQKQIALYDTLFYKEGNIYAMPFVKEVLIKLKEHDKKIAVVSSSSLKGIQLTLSQIGLKHFFDEIISTEMVKRGKPFGDVYQFAAKKFHLNIADCLVIEDSPAGIHAAKEARMEVIAYKGASVIQETKEADEEIYSFEELLKQL